MSVAYVGKIDPLRDALTDLCLCDEHEVERLLDTIAAMLRERGMAGRDFAADIDAALKVRGSHRLWVCSRAAREGWR